jgi:hypothetical protein
MMTSITRWILAHKRLVAAFLFWVLVTLVGIASVGSSTKSFSKTFSVPGREGFVTNSRITRLITPAATPRRSCRAAGAGSGLVAGPLELVAAEASGAVAAGRAVAAGARAGRRLGRPAHGGSGRQDAELA